MKKFNLTQYPGTVSYILGVVLINTLFLYIPLLSVLGTTMTPADVAAGSIYIFRDFAQREIRQYVIFAMIIASMISYLLTTHAIALASFAAFATAEIIDWFIFTITKMPLSKRLLYSAIPSAPVDSFVFCAVMGNLTWVDFTVMTLAKIFGVYLVWLLWNIKSVKAAN